MQLKCAAAFAAVSSLTLLSAPAQADTQIHAEYAAVYDRLRPDPLKEIHLRHSFDVTLSDDNNVSEVGTRAAGAMADQHSARTVLGQRNSDGPVNWTVLGPDKLQRVIEAPQSVMTMVITVTDKTCTLAVEHKLKPGFKEFKFRQIRNGEMGFFTQPNITETKCTIK
jgi:Cu/Ag efflux protein CusF